MSSPDEKNFDEQPPPSYDSIPVEPPPTYDSIFGELRNARSEASGVGDFLKKVIYIILSTIGCTVCLGLTLAIPIACIVLGFKYKNDCPKQDMIPIYLIVAGSFGVLRNIIGLYNQIKNRNENETEEENRSQKKTAAERTIDCFLFAWFIVGNVWIYRIYEPSYDKTNGDNYCDYTLYMFAFWTTTATYIFLGVMCCCMCCIVCCSTLSD